MANITVDCDSPVELTEQKGLLLKVAYRAVFSVVKTCSVVCPNLRVSFVFQIVIAGAFYPNYFVRDEPHIMEDYKKTLQRDLANRPPETTVTFQGYPAGEPVELCVTSSMPLEFW